MRRTHTFRLRDRRLLEFAEYGHPHGRPMFFFHGYMGSQNQASLVDRLAFAEGIRIIAPNRPGVGRSSPHRFRTMTEYAADVGQLADALGIGSFAVIGISGGGCFALACAYALPERVRMAGVFSGLAPLDVPAHLRTMRGLRRAFLSGCEHHPRLLGMLLRAAFLICRRYPRHTYDWLMERSSALEPDLIRRRDVRAMLWNDYQSVFLQRNGIRGVLDEAHVYFRWGFTPERFPRGTRVIFWHGTDDTIMPWSVLEPVARLIRHAKSVLQPGGHLSYVMRNMTPIWSRIKIEWDEAETVVPSAVPFLHSIRFSS